MAELEFHEDFARAEGVTGASDRQFGLTFAGLAGLVGAIRVWHGSAAAWWWLGVAALLLALALFWTAPLTPLNRLWFRFGLLLHKIVTPMVMALIFVTSVVPTGLVMRLCGKDPLRLRRDPKGASYWIAREPPGPAADSMKNQF